MNKQSQNTKQVRVLRNIWDEEFWQGASEIFSKTGIWTVCSCHVTYTFQSESTLCSSLNVKELLVKSRREIWSLSVCNWARTHNHLVHKRTLNHLAKPACLAWPVWLNGLVFVYELSGCELKSSCSHLNREIIRTHGKTGRNEPKWGDHPVVWRETAGMKNGSMRRFQPQLKIIYCNKKSLCHFFLWFDRFILA